MRIWIWGLLILTGCGTAPHSLSAFTKADAAAALALAQRNNDQSGVACYTSIGEAVDAVIATCPGGLLCPQEQLRIAKQQAANVNAACLDVFASGLVP